MSYLHHVLWGKVKLEHLTEVLDEVRLRRELPEQLVRHHRALLGVRVGLHEDNVVVVVAHI